MVEYVEDLEEEAHKHDNDAFLTLQKIEKLCVNVLPADVTIGHAKYEFARKVLKIIWDDKEAYKIKNLREVQGYE
tara:strand:+ start:1562 stop:1786 length:225 start_codon:yes stop_codon:yes gene_type:complete